MNGRAWTVAEIDALVLTLAQGGNTFALSRQLARSHHALMAKARRLELDFADPASPAQPEPA